MQLTNIVTQQNIDRTLYEMDRCIKFMTHTDYRSANGAMTAARKPMVLGLWIILALTLVVIIWGALVPIESAAHAHGSVILSLSKKTVQHLEGGIIEEIYVKEGDVVKAGQKLLRLKDTGASTARDSVQQQSYALRAARARLIAERDKLDAPVFDEDMVEKSQQDPVLAEVLKDQLQLFTSGRQEEDAKLGQLSQHNAQAQEEIKGLQSQMDGAAGQLVLLEGEIANVKKLLEKGYATETRLLALERNQSELQGSHGQYEAQIAKVQQGIGETDMGIVNQQKDFETKTLQELRDTEVKINDLSDKLRTAEDVEGRTVLTAPTEGVVTGLRFHTPGGVISPGAAVMDIVPQSEHLTVEVHIKPADISVVHADMDAKVMFTSYKMRTTPKIPGKVTQVSADVFTDEHSTPPSSYYTARVEVDKDFLKTLVNPVELYPGMPVDVMVRTGSRSFIGYLFKPITDSMQGAFREQ